MGDEYHGYPQGVPAPIAPDGVDLLRKKRGAENVTFNDIADHLDDYVRQHPASFRAIDGLAQFMAEVEDAEHDHNAVVKGSVASDGDPPPA